MSFTDGAFLAMTKVPCNTIGYSKDGSVFPRISNELTFEEICTRVDWEMDWARKFDPTIQNRTVNSHPEYVWFLFWTYGPKNLQPYNLEDAREFWDSAPVRVKQYVVDHLNKKTPWTMKLSQEYGQPFLVIYKLNAKEKPPVLTYEASFDDVLDRVDGELRSTVNTTLAESPHNFNVMLSIFSDHSSGGAYKHPLSLKTLETYWNNLSKNDKKTIANHLNRGHSFI